MDKECAFDECSNTFEQTAHNKLYCSDECCRLATNKKIMIRYHERKHRRSGAKFYCESCGGVLSRYTTDTICAACQNNKIVNDLNAAIKSAGNIKWD